MNSTTTAPRERVDWLASVMAQLQLLRREYKTKPQGVVTLSCKIHLGSGRTEFLR